MGITTSADGTLNIDSNALDSAISKHFDEFSAFFSEDGGVVGRLLSVLDDYSAAGGSIEQRVSIIEAGIRGIDDQRDTLALRLTNQEVRLRAQFAALDGLVASLTATSDFLTQQLSNLPGSSFGKKN
jgi:flagellar hook-associated protein 2